MFSAALLVRQVGVQIHTPSGVVDLGPWPVRAPTVRETVAVLEACVLADPDGDAAAEASWEILLVACRSWLPEEMVTRLSESPAFLCGFAPALIWDGTPDAVHDAALQQAEAKVKRKAREHSWAAVVAEYRAVYACPDPWSEPWPDFVSQMAQIDRVRARTALTLLDAHAAGNGAEGMYELLKIRAGDGPEELTEEDQIDALAKLQAQWASALGRDRPIGGATS